MNNLKLSIIIAVYERATELDELLSSLSTQTYKDFEVVVIDDGSKTSLKPIIEKYTESINLQYFYKQNSGPGKSRNYGMERANGNYFIFLDSDCIAPNDYLQKVVDELNIKYVDGFGGPDAASNDFNDLQKAISFAMTSVLTTGGIRGGMKNLEKFQPRSFNMGISKDAFLATGGFSDLRIGEDPDLSLTLWEKGFKTRLFPNAKVYHKRRTSLKKFAKQVYQFGIARPILNQRHPSYKKPVFWLPSLFLVGSVFSLLITFCSFLFPLNLIPITFLFLYFILAFILSFMINQSIPVAFISIFTTGIQLYSYGYGFLKSFIKINLLNQNPQKAFPSHYYQDNS